MQHLLIRHRHQLQGIKKTEENFLVCRKELAVFLDFLNPVASISHHSYLVIFLASPEASNFKVALSDCYFAILKSSILADAVSHIFTTKMNLLGCDKH